MTDDRNWFWPLTHRLLLTVEFMVSFTAAFIVIAMCLGLTLGDSLSNKMIWATLVSLVLVFPVSWDARRRWKLIKNWPLS
jgi:hypothetical protein